MTFDGYDAAGSARATTSPEAGGLTVHVAGALAGERALVHVDHVSPHHREAWGHILRLQTRSPHRARAIKDEAHRCGGCLLSHLDDEEERALKRARLADLTAALPGANLGEPAVRPAPHRTGYRSRAKYVVHAVPGGLVLGGYQPRSHRVRDTVACPTTEPAVTRAAEVLRAALERGPWPVYDEATGEGLLRYVGIRANERQEVLVTLVVAAEPPPAPASDPASLAALADPLLERGVRLSGLTLDVNPTRGNAIFSGAERLLWGEPILAERFGPARVLLSGHGFGQVNRAQAEALYAVAAARALADLPSGRPVRTIWELYAGAGALAQVMAHEAGDRASLEITAVERDETATRLAAQAWEELPRHGDDAGASSPPRTPRPTLRFEAADAAHFAATATGSPDVVVLDPPRAGLPAELRATLARRRPERLVYVSCDPATLARDLGDLTCAGYRATFLQGFDLMPLTPHLEVLVVLEVTSLAELPA